MNKLIKIALLGTFVASVSIPSFADGDAVKGERVFKKCAACHSLVEGKNGLGPSLAGVLGRTSGTMEGYKFSPAMTDAAVVWSEENLAEYLQKPSTFIKGTKMTFPGIKGAKGHEQIEDLIAFLKK